MLEKEINVKDCVPLQDKKPLIRHLVYHAQEKLMESTSKT